MEIRVRNREGKQQIFDAFRKKWLILTPEEQVRQGICTYLVNACGVPIGAIGTECVVKLNGQNQRCDAVVYYRESPVLLLECKRPTVKLTQAVFEQILRYRLVLQVPFLLLTNGVETYCFRVFPDGTSHFLPTIPSWNELYQAMES